MDKNFVQHMELRGCTDRMQIFTLLIRFHRIIEHGIHQRISERVDDKVACSLLKPDRENPQSVSVFRAGNRELIMPADKNPVVALISVFAGVIYSSLGDPAIPGILGTRCLRRSASRGRVQVHKQSIFVAPIYVRCRDINYS